MPGNDITWHQVNFAATQVLSLGLISSQDSGFLLPCGLKSASDSDDELGTFLHQVAAWCIWCISFNFVLKRSCHTSGNQVLLAGLTFW